MNRWVLSIAFFLCAAPLIGCARVQVPAIDKSGQRFFLPAPNSTTLTSSACPLFHFPQPAFTAPAAPPLCNSAAPQATVPQLPASPAPTFPSPFGPLSTQHAGAIVLSPTRLIAPVGSEVVLTAGICGGDGYFVTGQPIHWTLSPGGVGGFVNVGEGTQSLLDSLFHRQPPLLTSNHAVGRTSSRAELISRGTPSPVDDIRLRSGQGWVSLTSATEGTSTVTAQSPNASSPTPQTAIIHWVDAQWILPPTAIVKAGQRHVLDTVITRSAGSSPLAGWIVRYEIVSAQDGVAFAPDNTTVVERLTDGTGHAPVEIVPPSNQYVSAQVRIDIIRPANASVDVQRIVMGQGWTTVTWTAPGLAVNVTGPEVSGIHVPMTYRIEITNPGDMPTSGVVVADEPSSGLEVISSNPPGSQFGDRLEWKLPQLAPKSTQVITVNCRGTKGGLQRYCAKATSSDGLNAQNCADTRIEAPAIALSISGPETAEVGDEVEYRVEIKNQSDQTLTSVVLTDRFDAGLEHIAGELSPIEKSLDRDLAPGDIARVKIIFKVTRAGQLCHTLDIKADGGHQAGARKCLTATEKPSVPRPAARARITGPAQQRVKENAEYVMTVTNTGNVPLTDVQVTYAFAASLAPRRASDRHEWHEGGLRWSDLIKTLAPGEMQSITVICECLSADPRATSRVDISTRQGVSDTAETHTEILPAEEEARADEDRPPNSDPGINQPPASGELKVVINTVNSVSVDERITFFVELANDRDTSDKDVELTVSVSDEFEITRATSRDVRTKSLDKRSVEFVPIPEQRRRETIKFEVEARAVRAGGGKVIVKVDSLRSPNAIMRERMITVSP